MTSFLSRHLPATVFRLALGAGLLAGASLRAQTTLHSDTFSTDSLSGYTSGMTYGSSAGIGDTGGIVTDFSLQSTTANTGHALTLDQAYTVSAFLLYNGNNGTTSTVAGVGLSAGTSVLFAGNTPAFIGVAITNPVAGNWQLSYRYAYNTITGEQTAGSALAVQSGHWYRLTATITKSSTANNWSVAAELQDWGADGLAYTNTHTFFTSTGIELSGDTSLYTAGSLYPFFAARSFNGVGEADSFALATAIPEPSTYAMLAGVGALGLVLLRRADAGRRAARRSS